MKWNFICSVLDHIFLQNFNRCRLVTARKKKDCSRLWLEKLPLIKTIKIESELIKHFALYC